MSSQEEVIKRARDKVRAEYEQDARAIRARAEEELAALRRRRDEQMQLIDWMEKEVEPETLDPEDVGLSHTEVDKEDYPSIPEVLQEIIDESDVELTVANVKHEAERRYPGITHAFSANVWGNTLTRLASKSLIIKKGQRHGIGNIYVRRRDMFPDFTNRGNGEDVA